MFGEVRVGVKFSWVRSEWEVRDPGSVRAVLQNLAEKGRREGCIYRIVCYMCFGSFLLLLLVVVFSRDLSTFLG